MREREREREMRRPRGSFLVSVPRDFRRPERVELWPPPEKVPKTFFHIDRKKRKGKTETFSVSFKVSVEVEDSSELPPKFFFA